MKKAISLGMILSLIGSMAVFGAETESTETTETEFIPTYEPGWIRMEMRST